MSTQDDQMYTLQLVLQRADFRIMLLSCLNWFILMHLSQKFSSFVFGNSYKSLPNTKQRSWDTRFVAVIHAVAVCVLAVPICFDEHLNQDRVFGTNSYSQSVFAFTSGYFLWDIVVSIRFFDDFGVGSVVHAVLCFFVYFFTQRPFAQWYGGLFLLYEISTPFLHVSWFLDKMGMTGTPIQLFNGIVMLSAFFFMRIVIGFYESFEFFRSVYIVLDRSPLLLLVFYSCANITLNSLNVIWFYWMAKAVLKRIPSKKAS